MNPAFTTLTKEELIALIEIYSKNWLAMDGLWFQSIERENGMDNAMHHDEAVWSSFTVIEAKRIKKFLNLPEHAGIEGLKQALQLRLYANLNENEIIVEGNSLIYKVRDCRVQSARTRKQMPLHPCKPVGIVEYSEFAKVIDSRFTCECVSCFPDITDNTCCCVWKFTLRESK